MPVSVLGTEDDSTSEMWPGSLSELLPVQGLKTDEFIPTFSVTRSRLISSRTEVTRSPSRDCWGTRTLKPLWSMSILLARIWRRRMRRLVPWIGYAASRAWLSTVQPPRRAGRASYPCTSIGGVLRASHSIASCARSTSRACVPLRKAPATSAALRQWV